MSQTHTALTPNDKHELRELADWVEALPDSEFDHRDVDDRAPLRRLRRIGAVRVAGTRTTTDEAPQPDWDGEREREINAYEVTPDARAFVDDLEFRTFFECGHAGLENRGRWLECGFELCDRKFDPDDVIDGGDGS